ncbi:unnamed protein product [Nezara viridula]|uniref:XK-related protein n=1 Tax=Nezara viridula TaxID=85310 RepID=A0A9P0EAP2_NEZVI|nr:unnamed protein product [Nezara viridula]
MGHYEFLPLCDVLFNIISLAAYFCDIVFDLTMAYALYERQRVLWYSSTLFFACFSLLVCQAVSCRWYLRSIDARNNSEPPEEGTAVPKKSKLFRKMVIILVHLLQLGVLWRYFKLFMPVDLRYVKFEVRDLCILRLVHAFCQSAPLLLIQLHLLMNEKFDEDFTDLNIVSVSLSLFSVCWALASFSKNVRMHNVHKLVLTWLGVIFQFLWRLGTVSSRATCLVYYASAYGPWLLLVVVLHWAVVFLWLVCPGVSASNPPTVTTKGGALRATWLAAALAFLHLIAYANLDDNSSRLKAVMFYVVMGVENLVLLISWYLTIKPNYIPFIPLGAILSYILGLFFMALYYRFFHVRRLKYEAGGRMSTPENCAQESPEVTGSTPTSGSLGTPVKEEVTPPQISLKNHSTRYRYYGNTHRHGGIPGVFNCRFTNPYTAAMTKRKKKKPTSFVPPPSVLPSNHCPLPFWCRPLVSEEKNSSPLARLEEKKRQQLVQLDNWQRYPQQLTPAYLRYYLLMKNELSLLFVCQVHFFHLLPPEIFFYAK